MSPERCDSFTRKRHGKTTHLPENFVDMLLQEYTEFHNKVYITWKNQLKYSVPMIFSRTCHWTECKHFSGLL